MDVSRIIIGRRHRKDLGDIDGLAGSIAAIGLLHPIVVNESGVLIAGYRRLEACKVLGVADVPVTVVRLDNILRGEHDENACRKDFTPSEAVAIWQAMESYQGQRNFDTSCNEVRRIERAAEATGLGQTTLSKAKAVVEAAEAEPERYGDLVRQMDETGRVDRAYRDMRERDMQTQAAVEPPPMPVGQYRAIVIDPPWPIEKILRDVRPNQDAFDYPTMTLEQIAALPIGDLAMSDGCHIYLWTTHKHVPDALSVFDTWGVAYQCLMTWCKNVGFTPFSWMYSTEHVLFGHMGSLPLLRVGLRLDFTGKVREHSRKPDEFYDLVCQASPGPRLDMFGREKRDGFAVWGNEVGRFETVCA